MTNDELIKSGSEYLKKNIIKNIGNITRKYFGKF